MRRLRRWLMALFGAGHPRAGAAHAAAEDDDDLPFTAKEFARLIASGTAEDMRILASGLAGSATRRPPADRSLKKPSVG